MKKFIKLVIATIKVLWSERTSENNRAKWRRIARAVQKASV